MNSGIRFRTEDGATCDHELHNQKDGNRYDYSNLAVCCYECNQRKGNMTWEDWLYVIPTLQKHHT